MQIALRSGIFVESLRFNLTICIDDTIDHDERETFRTKAKQIASVLQDMAQENCIDINKDLRAIARGETELIDLTVIRGIQLDLKREFCSLAKNQ